ncbi:MAG: long-chain fatty acid--CoA ligase [Pseudomonadota bacterium]|nr:long-chain fatty acid--CoA ligase [Pseudomonadota bacterium]
MSALTFLLDRFAAAAAAPAIVWNDREYDYAWLIEALDGWRGRLAAADVKAGDVVVLTADFSPHSTAALLALWERGCIVVPMTRAAAGQRAELLATAEADAEFTFTNDDIAAFTKLERVAPPHPTYQKLRDVGSPGLVLFSSGSSGKAKGIVHDALRLLEKYKKPRHARRTIAFLSFDHIGGINTLLHVLSNGGTVISVPNRQPATVCCAIDRHGVRVLPTSPTFLNLLLLSGALDAFALSSLETITYGTEVMPEGTLARLHAKLPHVTLQQTYGLSEVGILRSKSESSDSLWVRLGGEGIETRVRNGMLEIRSSSAMVGYLNAPSPFTDDGWFMTGDVVDERGAFFRIHGRHSEQINVGGEKVFPAEIEDVLLQMDGVIDVAVHGEPHAILGQIVVATAYLSVEETLPEFRKRLVQFCRPRMQPFKVPQKVIVSKVPLNGERFKKRRGPAEVLA